MLRMQHKKQSEVAIGLVLQYSETVQGATLLGKLLQAASCRFRAEQAIRKQFCPRVSYLLFDSIEQAKSTAFV